MAKNENRPDMHQILMQCCLGFYVLSEGGFTSESGTQELFILNFIGGNLKKGFSGIFSTLCGGCSGVRGRSDCYIEAKCEGEEGAPARVAKLTWCISLIL